MDNPLNLYSLDISLQSIFATREGRLHVYSKWCRFEIPLVLSLSLGTVGARRRPRSYIIHVPDAVLGQVLRLWVCGGRKRFMAWNGNIGHPVVTQSTTIYVALLEGLSRRQGIIVNLTIYGDQETLIRSEEICFTCIASSDPCLCGHYVINVWKRMIWHAFLSSFRIHTV